MASISAVNPLVFVEKESSFDHGLNVLTEILTDPRASTRPFTL